MNRQDAKDAKQKDRTEPSQEADELARTVIGAAIEVHRTLGPGFLESVYEEALAVQLSLDCVPYRRQVVVSITRASRSANNAWISSLERY